MSVRSEASTIPNVSIFLGVTNMFELLQKNTTLRWTMTAIFVVLVALIVLTFASRSSSPDQAASLIKVNAAQRLIVPTASAAVVTPSPVVRIAVDVIGAIQQPGVYYLEPTARINDVVLAAGGLAPDANRDAINLAALVVDGQQIRVPRIDDVGQPAVSEPTVGATQARLINLNSADAVALDSLSGIGPATAQAIIEHRASNGPFKQIDDIQNVKGIGPSVFAKIKEHITVEP